MRLSEAERRRIAHPAQTRDLAFSSFVRWAALEAASDQLLEERPAKVAGPVPDCTPIVLASDPKPAAHYVDGELVSP